ncbi:class I SAM-dependent methyltransferase [Psychroserpens sp. AS72]|uniref:class I SAM-dependent methyltransferase n=1 Tax=Psychroserpens sp. AS72 TaxID=3135775 RepID=UPI0031786E92
MSNTKRESKTKKTPWPTKKAMEQVYDRKLWGENSTPFYSGEGSHHPKIVNPYLEAVTSFLTSFKSPLVVCDLGCGDFNVGKTLVKHTKKYIAVDIVPNLITHNTEKFIGDNLEFKCLDIAVDDLPIGDCVLLRQVLQHLSNSETQNILSKLFNFKYVILTEHLPVGDFIPNIDIISGQGIRLKKQSGIQILASPFNFKIKKESILSSITLDDSKGIIVTTLYTVV